jgi:ribose transport system substrate-binding protein
MRSSKATPPRVVALLLAVLCLAAAACGDDGEDGSASAGGASTGAAPAEAAGTDCVSAARAELDEYRAELPVKVPEQELDLSKVKGKNLWIILTVKNQFTQKVSAGAEEAIRRMGARATVFDGKGKASEWNKGVAQAVAQGADGIILWGVAPEIVSKPLAEATKKGIPAVDVWNGQPDDELKPGIEAIATSDYVKSAKVSAAFAMADSECQANYVLFTTKVLPLFNPWDDVKTIFDERCPDCAWQKEEIDLATMPTSLGPQVSNVVRRNPDINYIQAAFDSQITFIEPALRQAGGDVKIIGHDGTAAVLDRVREGGNVVATIAHPPEEWIGWTMADQLARVAAGQEPVDATFPERLIDETNVGESNADIWASWEGWEEQFAAKWVEK